MAKPRGASTFPKLFKSCPHCNDDENVARCPHCRGRGVIMTAFGKHFAEFSEEFSHPAPLDAPPPPATEESVVNAVVRRWFEKLPPHVQRTVSARLTPAQVNTVRQFFTKGLGTDDLLDAVEIAAKRIGITTVGDDDSEAWRYFCGVCWNNVRKMEGCR